MCNDGNNAQNKRPIEKQVILDAKVGPNEYEQKPPNYRHDLEDVKNDNQEDIPVSLRNTITLIKVQMVLPSYVCALFNARKKRAVVSKSILG